LFEERERAGLEKERKEKRGERKKKKVNLDSSSFSSSFLWSLCSELWTAETLKTRPLSLPLSSAEVNSSSDPGTCQGNERAGATCSNPTPPPLAVLVVAQAQ
jgi:hypothetical protein